MKKLIWGLGAALSLASCGTCVARGSKISTPRGLRRVEELAVGDEVIVVDPETHATSTSQIIAIKVSPRECGTLRFVGGALCVTSDHPIFDPDANGFFPSGDWLLGKRTALLVLREQGLEREVVSGVETFTRVDDVYDLSVAHEWHTFVADGVLVHNKEPPCGVVAGQRCACSGAPDGTIECFPNGGTYCFCNSSTGGGNGRTDAGTDAGTDADAGADGGMDGG